MPREEADEVTTHAYIICSERCQKISDEITKHPIIDDDELVAQEITKIEGLNNETPRRYHDLFKEPQRSPTSDSPM